MKTFTFYLGATLVKTNNINELREYVDEITNLNTSGDDLSKHLTDFMFDVESTYQAYHNLDPDNWDMIH